MDTIVNIMDGALGRHLGMNLPIGGAANPSPLGMRCVIAFRHLAPLQQPPRSKGNHSRSAPRTEPRRRR
eukprot:2308821-Amphidinium_carterae.2